MEEWQEHNKNAYSTPAQLGAHPGMDRSMLEQVTQEYPLRLTPTCWICFTPAVMRLHASLSPQRQSWKMAERSIR